MKKVFEKLHDMRGIDGAGSFVTSRWTIEDALPDNGRQLLQTFTFLMEPIRTVIHSSQLPALEARLLRDGYTLVEVV
jgi:hypothetical protein